MKENQKFKDKFPKVSRDKVAMCVPGEYGREFD